MGTSNLRLVCSKNSPHANSKTPDRCQCSTKIEGLNRASPQTPEEQHRVFVMKKQLVDELVVEAMIDGKRDIQVEFRAKIMDLAVSKQILDFPNGGEIVVRL